MYQLRKLDQKQESHSLLGVWETEFKLSRPMNDKYIIDDEHLPTDSNIEMLEELSATPKVAKWINKRLEYELRGAYQAGFNYLYFGEPRQELTFEPDKDAFRITYRAIPSYTDYDGKHPATTEYSDWIWYEYDLSNMPTEKYRQLVNRKG